MAQSMLSASGCVLLRSKPRAPVVRGSLAVAGGISSSKQFLLTCNASPSSPPPPPQETSDCNEEECAPEKEVGSLSAEWLAEERTQVVGTFPPKKKGWTGLVEKDTAGQTNIYSIEPTVYVAEGAISSGAAGASSEGAENTAAIAGGLVLITVAAASSILIQVSKNQPQVPAADYTGPPLSYYVAKFQPQPVSAPPVEDAPAPAETAPAVEEAAPAPETAPTVEASAATASPDAEEQLSS